MNIEQKLEIAAKANEEAIQALEVARKHYDEGPGKAYADALQTEAELKQRLATYREEASQAEAKFKELMAKAKYTVTKEVRNALNAKNDAIAIADEISEALQRMELERTRLLLEETSAAARNYRKAYEHAGRAAIEFRTYKALAAVGLEIAKVMALVPITRHGLVGFYEKSELERHLGFEELQHSLVMRELVAMTKNCDSKEYLQELGNFDLGRLTLSKIPSPVQERQMRQQFAAAAAQA